MNMDSEDDHEDYPWADFFMASSNPSYITAEFYILQQWVIIVQFRFKFCKSPGTLKSLMYGVKKYNLYNITSLYVIQVSDSQGMFIDYNMLFPYRPWYHP
jgi:hypothetical protein